MVDESDASKVVILEKALSLFSVRIKPGGI